MIKLIYVVALVATCTVFVASQEEERKVIKAFDRLNEFLEKITSDSSDSGYDYYINKAGELLAREEKNLFKSQTLIKSLKAFQLLPNTVGSSDDKCSYEKFMIIRDNNLAVVGRAREGWSDTEDNKHRIVDKVIRHYTIKHAELCQSEYPKLLRDSINTCSKYDLNNIHSLWGKIVEQRKAREKKELSGRELQSLLLNIESDPCKDAEFVVEELKRLMRLDNQDLMALERKFWNAKMKQFQIDSKKVERLTLVYLMPTCLRFMRCTRSVFDAAAYDDSTLGHPSSLEDVVNQEETWSFYQHWAYYRLCEGFMEHYKGYLQEVSRFASRDAYTLASPQYKEI